VVFVVSRELLAESCFDEDAYEQADMYRNFNYSRIGLAQPKSIDRFLGNAGVGYFTSIAWRIVVAALQDLKRFVERSKYYNYRLALRR